MYMYKCTCAHNVHKYMYVHMYMYNVHAQHVKPE